MFFICRVIRLILFLLILLSSLSFFSSFCLYCSLCFFCSYSSRFSLSSSLGRCFLSFQLLLRDTLHVQSDHLHRVDRSLAAPHLQSYELFILIEFPPSEHRIAPARARTYRCIANSAEIAIDLEAESCNANRRVGRRQRVHLATFTLDLPTEALSVHRTQGIELKWLHTFSW